ncbi:MAG: hypothetical protein J6W82_11825 [Bacteroidales bacterium]|nr:hypothetical protein [Bacteroidales bacterium]
MGSCRRYIAPIVIKEVSVALETNLLGGSTVNKSSEVKTVGQEVVTMDFSQTSFNQEWDK